MKNTNQSWEHHYCCPSCPIKLRSASRGNHTNLKFCTQMLWNEPQNHDVDCYFCNTTLIKGFNAKNRQQIVHANVPSVTKSVFIHVPKAENSLGVIANKRLNSVGYEPEPKRSKKNPILFDQAELNDLIIDINLLNDKAELLRSRLEEMNFLKETVRISDRNREKDLDKFFSDEDGIIYCNAVNKLMKTVGHKQILINNPVLER